MSAVEIGVAFVTYNASEQLPRSLPPVLGSGLASRVLVVDSSSNDGTVEIAQELGAETLIIPQNTFNHGSTRELARTALGTEIVVLMTQDAYVLSEDSLERVTRPVVDGRASLAYGRQVARPGANVFERFLRTFNYPELSHVRSIADIDTYGAHIFFSSDSFAAYRNSALDDIGGFRPTLSHEDAIAAAMLLNAGHSIAYVADAIVEHSHAYSLRRDFERYFDAGYAREEFKSVFAFAGSHSRLGSRYARELLALLARREPWLLPYGFLHLGAKGLGYTLGRKGQNAPIRVKRAFSGQDYYWQ